MRTIVWLCLCWCLASDVMGQAPEPPLSDTRLSIHTLVREDIFAGWRAKDMQRFARGENNIERLLEMRPDARADLLAWKGAAKLFRAVLAYESDNREEFQRYLGQSRELFKEAHELNAQSGGVAAVIGGSYVTFADRLPEELRAAAWSEAYQNYQVLWKEQSAFVDKLPLHIRGELLAGLAQSAHRTGRAQEFNQYLDKILEVLPGTGYGRIAKQWKEEPQLAAEGNISCKTCHGPGRLKARIAENKQYDAHAEYTANELDAEHATADVRLLRRALQDVHPGYTRYTSREALDQLLEALERRAADGMTDVELYREVAYLLAKIRCSHTKAEVPPALKEYRKTTPTYLPFTFRLFGGRMIVDQIDASQPNVARGSEVLMINGRAISDIISQVEDHLSVDGWTDHAKRVELESSSELLGDAIDHFWPALYEWPTQWTIKIRDSSGEKATRELAPVTYTRWLEMATGGKDGYKDFGPDTVEFRTLEDRTAYLSIDTFVNYRKPVNPVSLLQPHFEAMRQQETQHLVLDLRQCGGGSDNVPQVLASFLAAEPINVALRPSWVRTYRFGNLREHLHTWDDSIWQLPAELFRELGNGFYEFRPPGFRESITISPREANFEGRLTILSSAQNSSGATNLIALLRNRRDRVRVVGEPTGGNVEGTTAGVIFFLTLPHSRITVRIPALRNFNGIDEFQPGRGVTPDVLVMPDVDDFLQGRDRALQIAQQPYCE